MPPTTLRGAAELRDPKVKIGAIVNWEAFQNDQAYRELLAREFNVLIAENQMKFMFLTWGGRGDYDWTKADTIVDFAEANDMQMRGHTLVWHQAIPAWVRPFDESDSQALSRWTRDELIEVLREHITTLVSHYRGRIYSWDVVNEALGDDGSYRRSFWQRGIGDDYIEMAFRFAREADPDVLLFYNDFGMIEGGTAKFDGMMTMLRDLIAKGVPIDGVGFQTHIWHDIDDLHRLGEMMDEVRALGLRVSITEFDVAIPNLEGDLNQQAELYRRVLDECLSRNCETFAMWGSTDKYSWIPEAWGYTFGRGHTFDANYEPKPAHQALLDRLLD